MVFFLIPVVFSLGLSFTRWNLASSFRNMVFVGIDNYRNIFTDVRFTASLTNSLIFTVSTVVIGVSLSLILAVLISKLAYMKGVMKAMFFMPYVSSTVAIAIVWMILLQPRFGPLNQFLRSAGVDNPPAWLADMKFALPALIGMYIWQNLGYNIVVFIAGLSSISPELYEAADVDGAAGIRKFFKITVPMVSPTTFFLVIMGIINSFKVFDQVNVLTQGGPGTSTTVLALYIYREAFSYYRMGTASAAAWVMFTIIFIVTIIQWRGQKKWVTYE
jgi:multiple sugar transport system permease protein